MKRKVSLAVCIAILSGIIASCGTGGNETAKNTDLGEGYPINGENHITYWSQLDPNLATTVSSMQETEYAKELQKRTGVTVEYIHPSSSSVQEAFNIMLVSDDLPDIIEYSWTLYNGGLPAAYKNNAVTKLNDYVEEYAPDYMKYINEHPEFSKLVVSDDGDYLGIPFLRGDRSLLTSFGLIIRQDWLDDLGLDMPETMDELYEVLKAFKEKKNAEVPFSGHLSSISKIGVLSGAYGINRDFFVKDGKVVYGSVMPEYKEFLTTMNKWYNEKLIDNNFPTLDQKTINSNIVNGFSGMTAASGGSGLGLYIDTVKSKNENIKFAGAPYPVLNKGDKPQFGQINGYNNGEFSAVSSSCENIPLALKFLNYGYTEEGRMFNNFGIEGVSYNMVDGYPTYTDVITNNPDGLPMNSALGLYVRAAGGGGPFVQDPRYLEQYYRTEEQKAAWKTWSNTDADKYLLPQIYVDPERQSELSGYLNDIYTYEDEMFMKFVMGTESLDNFDSYVETLTNMGLNTALELYQDAYDRYLNR